jgi:integrase
MKEAVGDDVWEASDPDVLWKEDEELREAIRPLLQDVGETAQFLAVKGIVLDRSARNDFINFLYEDLAAALKRLIRVSEGDYSPDKYRERFPKFIGPDRGETPLQLFDAWAVERQPAQSTIESWHPVFRAMTTHFEGRSAGSLTSDEAQQWIRSLVNKERKASTVRRTWISASRTVFGWGADHKRISSNPFATVKVTVPKEAKLRETQAFRPDEWQAILKASLAISDTSKPFHAAQRWVPWLCAYTGARPGEITQLRKQDVVEQDGIAALRLTPDAGSIKTRKARVVPLHEHLIELGFLTFVAGHGEGPLFYTPDRKAPSSDPLKAKKPRSAQVRQRLAEWVRELGVDDPELRPNHAWRHTFKQRADRAEISERMSDSITGHAHKSVGAGYGAPTLDDMAVALRKFPRYVWKA